MKGKTLRKMGESFALNIWCAGFRKYVCIDTTLLCSSVIYLWYYILIWWNVNTNGQVDLFSIINNLLLYLCLNIYIHCLDCDKI